jgi:hypothetical protein
VAVSASSLDERPLLSFTSTIYRWQKMYALKWSDRFVRKAKMACDFEESFGTQKQATLKNIIPPIKTNCCHLLHFCETKQFFQKPGSHYL